ncbi:protein FAM228A isoform X2 [Mastacembelus armatus]|uniref:protein FAM228A isoform X2 n=1 Tax=Mastacembelus armatus TaxID=205130 RepID=UPI000E45C3A1|nr:protein FAM228B isoform X2 [Mastacembelus armatus]
MSNIKKNTASGVITFHTPFSVSLLKSEDCTTNARDTTETTKTPSLLRVTPRSTGGGVRGGRRDEEPPSRPKLGPKLDWLSHTPLRQLQAKMEDENQKAKEIIKPLQDTENGSVKGFVFLETYDPKEYNPFLLNIKTPHSFKFNADLQVHQRLKDKRTAYSCEAGCKYTRRHTEKLPQSDHPLIETATPQIYTPLQASSNYPAPAPRKTPEGDETEGRKSSRLVTIPYHIRASAKPNGRCNHTSCWFSRCGFLQQPARLQQLQSLSTSK